MISPEQAKQDYLTTKEIQRQEAKVKMEEYLDKRLKEGFSGEPLTILRSDFFACDLPFKEEMISEILDKYGRAGWCTETSESTSEYGTDLRLVFSEKKCTKLDTTPPTPPLEGYLDRKVNAALKEHGALDALTGVRVSVLYSALEVGDPFLFEDVAYTKLAPVPYYEPETTGSHTLIHLTQAITKNGEKKHFFGEEVVSRLPKTTMLAAESASDDELLRYEWYVRERGPNLGKGAGWWYVEAEGEIVCEINACATRDCEALAEHIVRLHNENLEIGR